MSLNFSYRILTSIFLLIILFISLFTNNFLWLLLLILASIISFYEFNNLVFKSFSNDKKKIFIINTISFLYLIIFVIFGYNFNISNKFDLIFIILICAFSDTGGYIIGKLIGGKKLTKISPKKTISGSIGSFVFSLFPIAIFLLFFDKINILDFYKNNLTILILVCLFLSLVCQLGDLFISYFKRIAKLKDTGHLLPGHGGLLDRIDGLIFVLPVGFILLKIFF